MVALRRSLCIVASCRSPLLHHRAHATTSDFLRSHILHRAPFSQHPARNTNANTNINTDGDENAESSGTTGRVIPVDRSGLCNPEEHEHKVNEESPMVKNIKSLIKFRGGPITVAEYMGEVLTNPIAGFYMNRDVFGGGGDFITSPEVSRMFGEIHPCDQLCLIHGYLNFRNAMNRAIGLLTSYTHNRRHPHTINAAAAYSRIWNRRQKNKFIFTELSQSQVPFSTAVENTAVKLGAASPGAIGLETNAQCEEGRLKEALPILPWIQLGVETCVRLLQDCASAGTLVEGKLVHTHMIKAAFRPIFI